MKLVGYFGLLLVLGTGGLAYAQAPSGGVQPPGIMGKRILTFMSVIRVNQIEATRDLALGYDEASAHTVGSVSALRNNFEKAFPGGRMTWSFSWLALHDQRENYQAIRKLVADYHRKYGDEITFIPGAYFAPMYNTREQINRDLHEGLQLVSGMVGGGYRPRSVIAGFLTAENQRYLAEVEGIHVCQGVIFTQFGVDNGDGEGSPCYPYYPSREHFCKPAQGPADFIDCVCLDGWSMDLLAARGRTYGVNSRLGLGPIETARYNKEEDYKADGGKRSLEEKLGIQEQLHTVDIYFGDGFTRNGFGYATVNFEVSVGWLANGVLPALGAEMRRRWPDMQCWTLGDFGEAFRAQFKDNSKLDYRFVQRGSGLRGAEPALDNLEIRWFMNRDFRLALVRDWTGKPNPDFGEREKVIDFTRYDLKAQEPPDPKPGQPIRNWSLMNRINQKQTRPQDKPVYLDELPAEDQAIIRKRLPELFAPEALKKPAAVVLESPQGGWTARVNPDGSFQGLEMTFGGKKTPVPWRQDAVRGPSWEGVALARKPGPGLEFEGRSASGQVYSLSYKDESGRLTITAGIRNESDKAFTVKPRARLTLGLDHEMKNPKTYFDIFLPTMLRSEKTHFWGYFQNPNGQVLAIASADPIASWQRGYIDLGHQIDTSHLDLMHAPPLPPRHPHNLDTLAPGAARSWRIALQAVTQIEAVNPVAAKLCGAPVFVLDRTLAAAGEAVDVKVLPGSATKPTVTATDAKGQPIPLVESEPKDGAVCATLSAPEAVGLVTLRAVADGKESEALVYIRKPWGWYLKQARSEALRMQQKPSQHRESWMGLFSAYWAHLYFPDSRLLAETEKVFEKVFNTMVNPATGDYYRTHPSVKNDHFVEWGATRPQNTSWMVGLLVARYAATRDLKHLELASAWGDKLIKNFQRPNGAFQGYTALTLGAKFLQELAWYERPLAGESAVWRERYDRHMESIARAARNMAEVKDLGETEGGKTYEDTQAGSAWSLLALHSLTARDEAERAAYLADSLLVRGRHECLTQALVPDARMRGGTLRWWEAQFDIPILFLSMMNSPHGWTMRSQFGALYLYLLTGEERYLNLAHNAMGACAQAVEHETGILRWAFIPDPYIWDGKFVTKPIGEQWLPMVSDRRRIADGKIATLFADGWSCDNDVHEHFRVMTEQFIPNAFVLERTDGSLHAWNCQVERKDGRILVRPSEPVVSRVHFNLKKASNAEVTFASGVVTEEVQVGMHWVGPGVKAALAPDIYLGHFRE